MYTLFTYNVYCMVERTLKIKSPKIQGGLRKVYDCVCRLNYLRN